MRGATLLVALASGGTVWILHLLAGYFLVSLGCAREWPVLGWTLASVTVACASTALIVAVRALRQRRRTPRTGAEGETARLLLNVAVLLSTLFAIMMILGGLTAAALPPCQTVIHE